MTSIDRTRVRVAFDAHARCYEAHACVQRRVVARMSALIAGEQYVPKRILDIGCGTGMLLHATWEPVRVAYGENVYGLVLRPG